LVVRCRQNHVITEKLPLCYLFNHKCASSVAKPLQSKPSITANLPISSENEEVESFANTASVSTLDSVPAVNNQNQKHSLADTLVRFLQCNDIIWGRINPKTFCKFVASKHKTQAIPSRRRYGNEESYEPGETASMLAAFSDQMNFLETPVEFKKTAGSPCPTNITILRTGNVREVEHEYDESDHDDCDESPSFETSSDSESFPNLYMAQNILWMQKSVILIA
uniref:Uncharacterized protein n=1 Tax=Glossina austeni TaxID=7395 RepID=A0A1A9UDD4_GLOAU